MLLVQTFSNQFLEQLAGASVRCVCLAALVMVLIALLRLRSAALQHAIWTVVLVSMLVLPVASLVVPALRLPVTLADYRQPAPVAPTRVYATEPIVIDMAAGSVRGRAARRAPSPPVWPGVLAAVYLAGALALLGRLFTGLIFSSRLVANSTVIRNSNANHLLEEVACEQLAEYPLPKLYESDQISAPVAAGGESLAILLPLGWRDWDDWKLRAVLAHELTHIRRGDLCLILLASLNQCLFWFHPLAWWLKKRLAMLAEQASDDAAVLVTGDPARYARVLLEMSSAVHANGRRFTIHSPSALSMAGARNVSRRVQRLLDLRNTSSGVLPKPAWVAIVACAIPLVSGIAAAQIFSQEPGRIEGDVPVSWQWPTEGFSVSADKARELEQHIASQPDDLAARAKLIAHYLYNAMPEALATHVLWVIEHHPDSGLAGSIPVSSSYPKPMDPYFEKKKQLWLRQAAIHYGNPRVLGNAAQFLMQTDHFAAEELLKRALELDQQNPVWSTRLAHLYSGAFRAGCYLRAGLKPFGPWANVEPSYPLRVRDQLDRSDDPKMIGTVGAALAISVVHSKEFRINQQPNVDEARRTIADYADVLLRRAQSLDPGNPQWTEPLRLLRTEPRVDASTTPALPGKESANASGHSSQRIRVGGVEQERQLIKSAPPMYSPLARQARIQGTVRLQVVIGPEGRITTTQLVHGHPLLVPSALEAVKSWIYRPTIVDGRPVGVETYVDVNFKLNE